MQASRLGRQHAPFGSSWKQSGQQHVLWVRPARLPQQQQRRQQQQQQRGRRRACAARSLASSSTSSASVLSSSHEGMTWASCVSSRPSVGAAVGEAADSILAAAGPGFSPQLALVFASCNYGSQLQDVVRAVRRRLPSVRHVFGCSAFGVLGSSPGGPLEVEGEPGLSLTLAHLPGVEVSVMHTLRSSIPSEDASPEAWADLVGLSPLEQLTPSRPPSAAASQEEEEEEEQQQEPDGEAPGSSSSASSSDSSSSSSGSSTAQQPGGGPAVSNASPPSLSPSLLPSSSAVNFLVLFDPRFTQSKQLLAGLDFAFPAANKVGGVLSQGQANKRRLMFAWSADGAVTPGSAAWARKQRRRQQQQQAAVLNGSQPQQEWARSSSSSSSSNGSSNGSSSSSTRSSSSNGSSNGSSGADAALSVQQQPPKQQPPQPQGQQQDAATPAARRGFFGGLLDALRSGLQDGPAQQQEQQAVQQQAVPARPAVLQVLDTSEEQADASSSEEGEADASSGVFMYGAAVLGLKGPLTLEPLTCQGYRTVSERVWTVGQTSRDGDLIGTLVDSDKEGGSDSDDEGADGDAEVVPLLALYDLLVAAGYDPDTNSPDVIEALSESVAVAIAPDTWRDEGALTDDDYTVAAIAEVWQKSGYIRIDGQARPGYRLRLVLRDKAGIREDLMSKLLRLKRAELAGVLAGGAKPPPLAALLFSDIGRGTSLYDAPNYESSSLASFLPVPLAGMHGSAQVSTVNGKAGLYELTSAIAVVRPLAQPQVVAAAGDAGATDEQQLAQ